MRVPQDLQLEADLITSEAWRIGSGKWNRTKCNGELDKEEKYPGGFQWKFWRIDFVILGVALENAWPGVFQLYLLKFIMTYNVKRKKEETETKEDAEEQEAG